MAFTYLGAKLGTGLLDPDGQPDNGLVTISTSVRMTNGGATVTGGATYRVAADGTLWTLQRDGHLGAPAVIAANDDPDTLPQGVAYRIVVSPRTGQGWSYFAVVPAASPGGVVDLSALAPLAIAPPLFGTGGGASVSDATSSVKGVLRLTGDLGGTAASPTVPGLASKAASVHTHAEADVTSLVADLAAKLAKPSNPASTSMLTLTSAGVTGTAAIPSAGFTPPMPAAGNRVYTASPGSETFGSSVSFTNNRLMVYPWIVTAACTIDRIGIAVNGTSGDAGCKCRLGIYADTGSCYPGALIIDAGQVAADVSGAQEATISQALTPGLVWMASVIQSAPTNKPPLIGLAASWIPPIPMASIFSGTFQYAGTGFAYYVNSVTAGLPSTFTAGANTTGDTGTCVPRIHVRFA